MSTGNTASGRGPNQTEPTGCVLTLCRGCCGTTAKHPDVDHTGQQAQLRAGIAGRGQVRISDCLDTCERSNVIVITPSPAGRRAGARPVWLGDILDPDTTAEVTAWVTAGGPGITDPPDALDPHIFQPSRRIRSAAERWATPPPSAGHRSPPG